VVSSNVLSRSGPACFFSVPLKVPEAVLVIALGVEREVLTGDKEGVN